MIKQGEGEEISLIMHEAGQSIFRTGEGHAWSGV